MSVNYLAGVVWRLENMDDSQRRDADARSAMATLAAANRLRSAARSVRGLGSRLRTRQAGAAWQAKV